MEINVVWSFHHVNMLIDCLACFEEGASVGAFLAADEEDGIVAGTEIQKGGHAVGDLAADGVVIFERGGGVDVLLYVSDDVAEVVEGFCGLGEQADVAREVEPSDIFKRVEHNSGAVGLAHEAQHFGVAELAEDGNLAVFAVLCKFLFDAFLQLEDDGAGCVDNLDVVAPGNLVGLRRFTMGAEEHCGVAQPAVFFVVDGVQSQSVEAVTLLAVMYDVAQAVESGAFVQFFLCLADGGGVAKAKPGVVVNIYSHGGRLSGLCR